MTMLSRTVTDRTAASPLLELKACSGARDSALPPTVRQHATSSQEAPLVGVNRTSGAPGLLAKDVVIQWYRLAI